MSFFYDFRYKNNLNITQKPLNIKLEKKLFCRTFVIGTTIAFYAIFTLLVIPDHL